jgi:hypothetical protein
MVHRQKGLIVRLLDAVGTWDAQQVLWLLVQSTAIGGTQGSPQK